MKHQAFILVGLVIFGFAGPWLVSAKSTEAVVVGIAVILTYVLVLSWAYNLKRRFKDVLSKIKTYFAAPGSPDSDSM